MNIFRPFFPALLCAAGCLSLTALLFNVRAQDAADTSVRPTVKPVVDLAANTPIQTEAASTPAPDADDNEKSPPQDDPNAETGTTETDITAEDGVAFKDNIATFSGKVKVVDPRFQLVCDRLTVFLNKKAPAGQNAASTPAPAATPAQTPSPTGKKPKGGTADPASSTGGSGIDHVVAEGHVVILQKKAATKPGEEEKVSVGRGEKGTFDNKSGDMVLTGWPSLEQNGSSLISLAQSTVMTIHRDSSLDTKGASKTTLIQKKGAGGSSGGLFDFGPASGGAKRPNNASPAPAPAASPNPTPGRAAGRGNH